MRAVIETPRWSFTKYRREGDGFVPDLAAPLPTLFNYGYVVGTMGEDGAPSDIIVLGERLDQGSEVDVLLGGMVSFTDDGKKDDKMVGGVPGPWERLQIWVFFTYYALFKKLRYRIFEGRWADCRYGGFKPLSRT